MIKAWVLAKTYLDQKEPLLNFLTASTPHIKINT